MTTKYLLLLILILTSCSNRTKAQSLDSLTLLNIGQKLNGHWRLVLTETEAGQRLEVTDSLVEHYEFKGVNGFKSEIRYNKDGTLTIPDSQPACVLKINEQKILIEYIGLVGRWRLEILNLTDNKLVLTDSVTTWTYKRQKNK